MVFFYKYILNRISFFKIVAIPEIQVSISSSKNKNPMMCNEISFWIFNQCHKDNDRICDCVTIYILAICWCVCVCVRSVLFSEQYRNSCLFCMIHCCCRSVVAFDLNLSLDVHFIIWSNVPHTSPLMFFFSLRLWAQVYWLWSLQNKNVNKFFLQVFYYGQFHSGASIDDGKKANFSRIIVILYVGTHFIVREWWIFLCQNTFFVHFCP